MDDNDSKRNCWDDEDGPTPKSGEGIGRRHSLRSSVENAEKAILKKSICYIVGPLSVIFYDRVIQPCLSKRCSKVHFE